jgi:hypothetical protein
VTRRKPVAYPPGDYSYCACSRLYSPYHLKPERFIESSKLEALVRCIKTYTQEVGLAFLNKFDAVTERAFGESHLSDDPRRSLDAIAIGDTDNGADEQLAIQLNSCSVQIQVRCRCNLGEGALLKILPVNLDLYQNCYSRASTLTAINRDGTRVHVEACSD